MKNLLCLVLFLFAKSHLFAQHKIQADSLRSSQSNSTTFTAAETPTFCIKFYPFWLIQGVKLEAGYRFSPKWEVNVTGQYYYRSFFWYRSKYDMTVMPYYLPTDGFGLFASADKNIGNGMHLFGFKAGYRSKKSAVFNVDNVEYDENVRQLKNEFLAMGIYRLRSNNNGFFVEFTAECGIRVQNLTEEVWKLSWDDYSIETNTYVYPHLLVGFAVGFGW